MAYYDNHYEGKNTKKLVNDLNNNRLFTFEDYSYLFINAEISTYKNYPIYKYLNIKSTIKRDSVTHRYKFNKEDYIKLLNDECPKKLLLYLKERSLDKAWIKQTDLEMGTVFIAGSGRGKTTLMANILRKLIHSQKNYSFVVIDPHGHLAKSLSELDIDESRIMNFSLKDFRQNRLIFSYNVFDITENDPLEIELTISNIVNAISELPTKDGHKVSASMESVLTFSLKFLFKEFKNPTLLDLYDLLSCNKIILAQAQLHDNYFKERFIKLESASREGARRRVENALKSDVMKQILCSSSTFDLEASINSNKIMLFDLSRLGPQSSVALGKFLIANIKNYVRKRDPDNLKNHTYLVIDEAPVFVGDGASYEDILSQKRKYGLHTMLACQYSNQFNKAVESVKYNTAIKIVSGESPSDFKNMITIPQQFLKKDRDGKVINKINLDQFQFLVHTRGRTIQRFQAEDEMLIPSNKERLHANQYYRTDKDQLLFLKDQYKKYYKPFSTNENPIVKQPNQKLEPLKDSGDQISIPDIPKLGKTKELSIMYQLATYKFLSKEQMLKLGIAKFDSGLPTSQLEKDGYIKSVRTPLGEDTQFMKKIYFLTKKGAKFIDHDSDGILKINFPTSLVKKISQVNHKMAVINTHIELSRFDLVFCHKDIDNSGIRNVKETRITWGDNMIEPDLLVCINTSNQKEYFTFEIENGHDVQKSYKKILQHKEMIVQQAYQKQYSFTKEHRSCWIFEKESTMRGVIKKCNDDPTFPNELFLFKVFDGEIYHGWLNQKNESRKIFYT